MPVIARWGLKCCLALIILSGLSACKLFKKAGPDTRTPAWVRVLDNAKERRLDFETLSIQGKGRIAMPEGSLMGNQSASYRIHMLQDSLIWIKVSKLGFEGARVLIRPDSIFVLNRINKEVYAEDYSIAEKYTGLKADFGVLQDLLVGHFHPIPRTLEPADPNGNPLIFSGESAGIAFDYEIEPDVFKLIGLMAAHTSQDQRSTITYDEFDAVSTYDFPMNIEIAVEAPTEMGFSLSHRKVQHNPANLSFSFSVPANYDRMSGK